MGINNKTNRGIADDRGTTKPFWCLTCEAGFHSPARTRRTTEAKHQNRPTGMRSRGLSKERRLEAFGSRDK